MGEASVDWIEMISRSLYSRVESLIELSPALRRLELLTRPNNGPGLSLSRLFLVKLRVVAEWLFRRVLETQMRAKTIAVLKSLRNSKAEKIALVLANGPSLSKLDIKKVSAKVAHGDLEIWGVNYFPLSHFANVFESAYKLVLSDPETKPTSKVQAAQKLWEELLLHPPKKIFVPVSWSSLEEIRRLGERIIYFDDLSLEGWTSNVSPVRARGYSSLTAYKALAISQYLGYKETFILGFDNSMFQTLVVNEKNELYQKSNHAPGTGSESDAPIKTSHPFGTSDYFYDLSKSFYDLKKYFGKFPIINLDKHSLVDAFEKQSVSEFLS